MTTAADTDATPARDPAAVHAARSHAFALEVSRHERRSNQLSTVRLLSFIGGAVLVAAGVSAGAPAQWGAGLAVLAIFVAAVIAHARVIHARDAAQRRREIHDRHLMRLQGKWLELESRGDTLLPSSHPYAWDIDVIGRGSLFQRIDVTHTVHGEHTLAGWLGQASEPGLIARRQQAVLELAENVELRQELEAAALAASEDHKLDGRAFQEFAALPPYVAPRPWLAPTILALPLSTLALYLLGSAGVLIKGLWLLPLIAQLWLLTSSARPTRRAFDVAAARQGVVEAFEQMLIVAERARFDSELLQELQGRLTVGGDKPSAQMGRLKAWASAAELRQQFLFYVFINPLTLWDLHVLRGLERWNAEVGSHTADWFAALGELEALSSLATLAYGDPDARMPEIVASDQPLQAEGLAHPLLSPAVRVENDLALAGPGSAVIITGSNMAGKSTMLRAVGLNVALALSGGPVCASSMRVPHVRLRASMRINDSLQEGASYFHAELTKLRSVVDDADERPPVLFLLDELLRGTNAKARHVGARAVLEHMLERGATGIVATHDVALSALEQERPGQIRNLHFTDVVADGEMRFDYRLREGVVRTSNALRLLAMAGIDVPKELSLEDLAPAPASTPAEGDDDAQPKAGSA